MSLIAPKFIPLKKSIIGAEGFNPPGGIDSSWRSGSSTPVLTAVNNNNLLNNTPYLSFLNNLKSNSKSPYTSPSLAPCSGKGIEDGNFSTSTVINPLALSPNSGVDGAFEDHLILLGVNPSYGVTLDSIEASLNNMPEQKNPINDKEGYFMYIHDIGVVKSIPLLRELNPNNVNGSKTSVQELQQSTVNDENCGDPTNLNGALGNKLVINKSSSCAKGFSPLSTAFNVNNHQSLPSQSSSLGHSSRVISPKISSSVLVSSTSQINNEGNNGMPPNLELPPSAVNLNSRHSSPPYHEVNGAGVGGKTSSNGLVITTTVVGKTSGTIYPIPDESHLFVIAFPDKKSANEAKSVLLDEYPRSAVEIITCRRSSINSTLVIKGVPFQTKIDVLVRSLAKELRYPPSYTRLYRSDRGVFKGAIFMKFPNRLMAEHSKFSIERIYVGTRPLKVEYKKHFKEDEFTSGNSTSGNINPTSVSSIGDFNINNLNNNSSITVNSLKSANASGVGTKAFPVEVLRSTTDNDESSNALLPSLTSNLPIIVVGEKGAPSYSCLGNGNSNNGNNTFNSNISNYGNSGNNSSVVLLEQIVHQLQRSTQYSGVSFLRAYLTNEDIRYLYRLCEAFNLLMEISEQQHLAPPSGALLHPPVPLLPPPKYVFDLTSLALNSNSVISIHRKIVLPPTLIKAALISPPVKPSKHAFCGIFDRVQTQMSTSPNLHPQPSPYPQHSSSMMSSLSSTTAINSSICSNHILNEIGATGASVGDKIPSSSNNNNANQPPSTPQWLLNTPKGLNPMEFRGISHWKKMREMQQKEAKDATKPLDVLRRDVGDKPFTPGRGRPVR